MGKNERPIIVGLDIGTTKVVAIAGRKNENGKLEVLGYGKADSVGVHHGVVQNIEQCIVSIQQALEKCILSNPDLEIREVYVGIAGQHIKSLQTRGDRVRTNTENEISKEDIEMLIKDQRKTYIPAGDQIIDIIPQDYTVDSTPDILNPVGMSGVKIGANFHVITSDKGAVRNIMRCIEKSHLRANDLVLQPIASAMAVMGPDDLEAGVAVVDIGGGTTDMAVFLDGILKHTAVIPYAGTNITNDIRNGLGVLRAQAEQMKVQFGTAIPEEAHASAYISIPGLKGMPPKEILVRNLSHIIQARMQEIMEYVLYHLRQINLDKRLYGGIILTGGGAQLKHIIQLTNYVTGINSRLGSSNEHLTGDFSEELKNPMYATCIGLILRGYNDVETGKVRSFADGGNYLHVAASDITSTPAPQQEQQAPVITKQNAKPAPSNASSEQQTEQDKQTDKRTESMRSVFDVLKGKFMSMFEDVKDTEL